MSPQAVRGALKTPKSFRQSSQSPLQCFLAELKQPTILEKLVSPDKRAYNDWTKILYRETLWRQKRRLNCQV